MPYVLSTLSADNEFVDFVKTDTAGSSVARPATAKMSVLIKGGANVTNKQLVTLDGVLTYVNEAQADFLRNHKNFQRHLDRGHLKIIEKEVAPRQETVTKIAANEMVARDSSAQLDESKGDFKQGGRAAGVKPKNTKVE